VRPRITINADDFGWLDGQNLAVEKAHSEGVLDSASLLANGDAFIQAVEMSARLPNLHVGVHLSLNEGKPILEPEQLPNLVRQDGQFMDTVSEIASLWLRGKLVTTEVIPEWRQQIQRVIDHGISPSHIDSHKHVHVFPPLLKALLELAEEFNIPYVRLPQEPVTFSAFRRGPAWLGLWALAGRARKHLDSEGIRYAARFIGIAASGAMTTRRLSDYLEAPFPHTIEIMVHPAVETPDIIKLRQEYKWAKHYQFEEELEALCSKKIIALKARLAAR